MVRFDATFMRYATADDFRVLSAVELGMRNHELVPTALVERLAGLPTHGAKGVRKILTDTLLREGLVRHSAQEFDGFALNYSGYDFLALRALSLRGLVCAVGRQIGTGKESDVYLASGPPPSPPLVLKLHRLGRTSFRAVARTRGYKRGGAARRGESFLYLSRLAATKEAQYLSALHAAGYPVPKIVGHSRHAVLMEQFDGLPLASIRTPAESLPNAPRVYAACLAVLARLCADGVVHGDFNEFNIMANPSTGAICVIDFPQMLPWGHPSAAETLARDVASIHSFFVGRAGCAPIPFTPPTPTAAAIAAAGKLGGMLGSGGAGAFGVGGAGGGFTEDMQSALDRYRAAPHDGEVEAEEEEEEEGGESDGDGGEGDDAALADGAAALADEEAAHPAAAAAAWAASESESEADGADAAPSGTAAPAAAAAAAAVEGDEAPAEGAQGEESAGEGSGGERLRVRGSARSRRRQRADAAAAAAAASVAGSAVRGAGVGRCDVASVATSAVGDAEFQRRMRARVQAHLGAREVAAVARAAARSNVAKCKGKRRLTAQIASALD